MEKFDEELIAEFMGEVITAVIANTGSPIEVLVLPRKPISEFKTGKPIKVEYRKSWEWLMPVVMKIESIDNGSYGFTIDPWGMEIIDYSEPNENVIVNFQNDDNSSKISQYYYCVVEFIKWYNNKKNND